MRVLRIIAVVAVGSGIAGCVLPPAFTIASFVADGVSVASSGKTVTDHAISLLAHEDCRVWRLLQGKSICQAETTVVAEAKLPPKPVRTASPGLRAAEVAAAGFILDAPDARIAIPFPAPKSAPAEPPAPAHAAPPARPRVTTSIAPSPSSPPTMVASFILDEPDTAIPVSIAPPPKVAVTPGKPAPAGGAKAPASVKAAAQQASPPMPIAPAATAALSGTVRGEMVIRSGTDETEARALAESLRAVGATVRPVRRGDITVYEVVMGLSG